MDVRSSWPEYADALLKGGTHDQIDRAGPGTRPVRVRVLSAIALIRYMLLTGLERQGVDRTTWSSPSPDAAVRYAKSTGRRGARFMAYPKPADNPGDQRRRIDADRGCEPGQWRLMFAINVLKKPYDYVRVRRAINWR